mgnify:CR=1 FL=1
MALEYSREEARVARSSSHSIRRFFALVAKVFDVLDPLLSLSNLTTTWGRGR